MNIDGWAFGHSFMGQQDRLRVSGPWKAQCMKATERQEMERGNSKARNWMDGRQGGLSQPQARGLAPHWSSPGTTPRHQPWEVPHVYGSGPCLEESASTSALPSWAISFSLQDRSFCYRASGISPCLWWVWHTSEIQRCLLDIQLNNWKFSSQSHLRHKTLTMSEPPHLPGLGRANGGHIFTKWVVFDLHWAFNWLLSLKIKRFHI